MAYRLTSYTPRLETEIFKYSLLLYHYSLGSIAITEYIHEDYHNDFWTLLNSIISISVDVLADSPIHTTLSDTFSSDSDINGRTLRCGCCDG